MTDYFQVTELPNHTLDNYLGYIEYVGQGVQNGLLDARKSANALSGLDSALRFVLTQENPIFNEAEFEIPVRIQSGSWQALIPQSIGAWVITAAGLAMTTYLTTAAKKLAEHDFHEVGVSTLFQKGIKSIQGLFHLGKHLGTMHRKSFKNLKWRNENREVGVPNDQGKYVFVTSGILDLFASCPQNLLSNMTSVVSDKRTLNIGIIHEGKARYVSISQSERAIFCIDEEKTDILFPELEHGRPILFDGLVTRGNENTNSIGFEYNGHILTCYPRGGSIVRFKRCLFVKCRIAGTISRVNKSSRMLNAARPMIIFDTLDPISGANKTGSLFPEITEDE